MGDAELGYSYGRMRAPSYVHGELLNQLGEDMARIPMVMIDDKRRQCMTARVAIPLGAGRPPFVVEGVIYYGPAMAEASGGGVGALFKGKIANAIKDKAKALAKNKAFRAIAKTAPIWGNLIPPPAGQVIAAGSAAAQIAMKLKDAADKGDKKAKAFVAKAKNEKAQATKTVKSAMTISQTLKKVGVGPEARKKAIRKVVNDGGVYEVKRPDGSIERIPASLVRA